MTSDETSPFDEAMLDELLAADAAMAGGAAPVAAGVDDESWEEDCLQLINLINRCAALPEPERGSPSSFGRFVVVREVGRGGFGVVYHARDPVLARDVALKVPRPEMLVTAKARRRFTREARAAAILDHPNIVPVYEADVLGPVAYIASAYCEGPSLSAWLKARHEPVAARTAARLLTMLAGAVQHAHERGILHRDLKPSNVVLQASVATGTTGAELLDWIPRVTDFGLAKRAEDDGGETRSGVPLGSPPYMAPEQAAGRLRDLGPATDVYALGATLYEILTGRAPFRGETPAETIRQVIENDPVIPRMLRPDVPRDLETICLHCLRKDHARRYPSAAALGEDLERFLAGQPIQARPASVCERGLKWSRRRPAHAALVALTLIAALASAGAMAWSNTWLRAHNERLRQAIALADRHADEAERQRRLAVERKALGDRHLHAAQLRLAQRAWDGKQFERAQEVLLDAVYGPGPTHRDFAWWYLWRQSRREVALLGRHEAPVRRVDLSPDGHTLASGDAAGAIILWDTLSMNTRATLSGHAGAAKWIAFSPDGRTLASCGEIEPTPAGKKEILIWDVVEGRLRSRPVGDLPGEVRVMTFMDGGRLLSVVTRDADGARTIRVWDLESDGSRLRYVIAGLSFVMASPDGRFFAVHKREGELTLREATTGRVTRTVSANLADASALAVSADGRSLAAAAAPNLVLVWDLSKERPPRVYSDDELRPDRLVFSPDGSTLVAVTEGKQVSLRDLGTGRRRVIVALDSERVGTFNLAFSGDGRRLALYGDGPPGGTVPMAIWRVDSGLKEKVFPGRRTFQYMSFAADDKTLYLGGDHDLSIWRPYPDHAGGLDSFVNHGQEVWAVAFSVCGKTVATGGGDNTLRLWDPATGGELAALSAHTAPVAALAFRGDGRAIASGSLEARDNLKLWDAAAGRLIKTLPGHTDHVRSVAFQPGGDLLASAGSDGTVRLWDGATGAPRAVLAEHGAGVRHLAFSPDGLTLASASIDRTVRLWDVRRRQCAGVLWGRYAVASAAFSRDGLTLASADAKGFITLWDLTTQSPRRVINGDDDEVRALAFSPDGQTIASAGVSRSIRLWDPVTGQELLTLDGGLGHVNALAFSPDGSTLVSADHLGFARFYRGTPD